MMMCDHLFEPFSKMIASLPPRGVLKAIELEHWMIEADLAHERSMSVRDTSSILSFSRFLLAVKFGMNISPSVLPAEHVPFYRDTVERLIVAGELPANARERFDAAFSTGFLAALVT
jgi:hypothetical protein